MKDKNKEAVSPASECNGGLERRVLDGLVEIRRDLQDAPETFRNDAMRGALSILGIAWLDGWIEEAAGVLVVHWKGREVVREPRPAVPAQAIPTPQAAPCDNRSA